MPFLAFLLPLATMTLPRNKLLRGHYLQAFQRLQVCNVNIWQRYFYVFL